MTGAVVDAGPLEGRPAEVPRLSIEVAQADGHVVVSPAGELDVDSVPRFELVMQDVVGSSPDTVEVDLARVTFLDSAGLRALVTARRQLQSVGASMCVSNPCDSVQRLLVVTRLDGVLSDGTP